MSRRLVRIALATFVLAAATPLVAPAQTAATQPDAVYELWEQDWTLNADGSIVYHENKHLRLNSDRVFRDFGDPRFDYDADNQTLEILAARTRLPNGKYVELADYSAVEVAPDAAGGWPAFGAILQRVLVMGGIEPGCVLENEFRLTTKPGVRPYLAADLHIDDRYPVKSRTITVTVPHGKELSPIVGGIKEGDYLYSFDQHADGSATHRWVFAALPGDPHEPQEAPWYEGGVRLAFTTAASADAWIREQLTSIETAADESPILTKLAGEWTKDQLTASDKLGALQSNLAKTFNFVNFDVDWRPARPRNASDVIRGNYGLPAEAAAVLLSLAHAAGVPARPALLVADDVWDDHAPQAAMVSGYILAIESDGATELWHPHDGRVQRSKRWSGYAAISASASGFDRIALPAWNNADESRCIVAGSIDIADNGEFTGSLTIRTTGLFATSGSLDTREDQKNRVESIISRILPDAELTEFTMKSLTPNAFDVDAVIKSDGKLGELHGCYEIALLDSTTSAADVPLPLSSSRRETPVRLTGAFDERIDLTVNWPENWTAVAVPQPLAEKSGQWGALSQQVEHTEHGVRLTRHCRINQRTLAAADLLTLRGPLNDLRADGAHTLILRP